MDSTDVLRIRFCRGTCIVASASSMNVAIFGSCFSGLAWGALVSPKTPLLRHPYCTVSTNSLANAGYQLCHRERGHSQSSSGTAQLLFQGVGTFGNLIAAIGGGALVAHDSDYQGWRIVRISFTNVGSEN